MCYRISMIITLKFLTKNTNNNILSIFLMLQRKLSLILFRQMKDVPDENENEQMIESQKDKVVKAKTMKIRFYIFSIIAMILLGTKMVCIGVTKMNKFWVNFIEHIAILLTAFICYLVVRYNAKRSNNDHLDKIE